MEAKLPESVGIARGWHMGHVDFASFQLFKLLKGGSRSRIDGSSQGKCNKSLFQVQADRGALEDIFLEIGQGLEDSAGEQLHFVGDACQLLGGSKDD